MMRTVQPPAIAGHALIKFMIWLFGIFIAIIIGIAVTTVTFMETTVIEDATLKSEKEGDIACFTVLNNHAFFDMTPAIAKNSCNPTPAVNSDSPPVQSSSTQWFFEMVQHNTLFLLAHFKEFWTDSTNNTCHPFLHIRDNGNNCVSERVCGQPEITYFDAQGKPQKEFSFVTTAKSQLKAKCSLTKTSTPAAGALMVFYGFSCDAHLAQQGCEKQSIVHTEHRLNYFTPTR
jgi:hypothetical protein